MADVSEDSWNRQRRMETIGWRSKGNTAEAAWKFAVFATAIAAIYVFWVHVASFCHISTCGILQPTLWIQTPIKLRHLRNERSPININGCILASVQARGENHGYHWDSNVHKGYTPNISQLWLKTLHWWVELHPEMMSNPGSWWWKCLESSLWVLSDVGSPSTCMLLERPICQLYQKGFAHISVGRLFHS